jgi:drug/metabolite transporter (DMT)-like permease
MLLGGLLLLASALLGEPARFHLAAVSTKSALALVYLVVFGALIAFTAYVWLLRVAPPVLVSTYAYVNPVVAVFLGWAVAGEPITRGTLIAAAVILAGVALISSAPSPNPNPSVARFESRHAQAPRTDVSTDGRAKPGDEDLAPREQPSLSQPVG